ncbi:MULTISPECIES: pentapeptide repeat-containing protein [Halorussus]|uniref:pentapeptide repeat-containing protein n=1 Tax=Halorussus TaxID=1070314 RepID=UPI00209FE1BE|nr:pentapeptide repeat-containing protein [Halorussus vallis]USZ75827.1 pentapeptide repeat-containing protein [Halorussus vallis]
MSTSRCGYIFRIASPLSDQREACCTREVLDGADRCAFHLDGDKSDVIRKPLTVGKDERLSESVFRGANLAGEEAFAGRTLNDCDFSSADLRHVDFSEADLTDATFCDADLRYADLTNARLQNADFTGAQLQQADLVDADGRGATFEGANLENTSFTRTNLRNATIVDAELYEAAFSDTWINQGTELGETCVYETKDESESADAEWSNRYSAAAWTYRALEQLCRENALPRKTRKYYIREKNARRKFAWHTGDYRRALKAEGSRWVMEYGSNPWRVVGVSAVVILLSAMIYPLTGGIQESVGGSTITYSVEDPTEINSLNLSYLYTVVFLKSLYFSIVTFATLGYGDISPIGAAARAVATFETIMGSLLIALLVFVLSRSVTW